MTYYPNSLNCTYCGTPLTSNETEYIQRGVAVRCRGCGSILTSQSFEDTHVDLTDHTLTTQQPVQKPYRPSPKKSSGTLIFFIGFVSLSLGLYALFFPIPFFSSTYYGEILGAIATIIGLYNLMKESTDPSGISIMIIGLAVWLIAWMSWIIYIPILSDFYYGEAVGLLLIIYGYFRSKR